MGPTQQIVNGVPPYSGLPSPAAESGAVRPELPAPAEQPRDPPPRADFSENVESLRQVMRGINGRLDFDLIEGSSQLYVQVVDRGTNEVIRTMPPQELLDLKRRIDEAVGAIVDELV